jgi:cytidylate kinase
MKKIVIAIDGHSSCGKSTLAKSLAEKLNYIYVDTGAMYRSVALFALQNGLLDDHEGLRRKLTDVEISFIRENGVLSTYLDGVNVEDKIRTMEISNLVSNISSLDFVREKLVEIQQKMGDDKGIVMDGRDIGTVVFPKAELKIFLTASSHIRARRRFDELTAKGDDVSFEEIQENIESRDYKDENRKISPLRKADDAFILDNSDFDRDEQLEWVLAKLPNLLD